MDEEPEHNDTHQYNAVDSPPSPDLQGSSHTLMSKAKRSRKVDPGGTSGGRDDVDIEQGRRSQAPPAPPRAPSGSDTDSDSAVEMTPPAHTQRRARSSSREMVAFGRR